MVPSALASASRSSANAAAALETSSRPAIRPQPLARRSSALPVPRSFCILASMRQNVIGPKRYMLTPAPSWIRPMRPLVPPRACSNWCLSASSGPAHHCLWWPLQPGPRHFSAVCAYALGLIRHLLPVCSLNAPGLGFARTDCDGQFRRARKIQRGFHPWGATTASSPRD